MDGSLLSDAKLLNASRDFVCARLVTYEDAEEGEYLKTIGGSHRLEVANTTFVLLAPDGKTTLSKSGRAPRQSFTNADGDPGGEVSELLSAMQEISIKYPGNGETIGYPVPYLVDVRRALNVAACDNQPLVVYSMKNQVEQDKIEQELARLAWSPNSRGRFAYVKSTSLTDFEKIANVPENATNQDVVFVVQPGIYGLNGKVISVAKQIDQHGLQQMLKDGTRSFTKKPMDHRQLQVGKKNGVEWEEESMESRTPSKRQRNR